MILTLTAHRRIDQIPDGPHQRLFPEIDRMFDMFCPKYAYNANYAIVSLRNLSARKE